MENITFRKTLNEQGRITGLEIGGLLVLENSLELKKEFVSVIDCLSNLVKITVLNTSEIDLSCIQLFVSFIKHMDGSHVGYQFEWDLDEDQKSLLENVGLSSELYLNNSYV
jgi:hypothetical protein